MPAPPSTRAGPSKDDRRVSSNLKARGAAKKGGGGGKGTWGKPGDEMDDTPLDPRESWQVGSTLREARLRLVFLLSSRGCHGGLRVRPTLCGVLCVVQATPFMMRRR